VALLKMWCGIKKNEKKLYFIRSILNLFAFLNKTYNIKLHEKY